ncbi:universal stress protein [Mycobacterium montefiorense]|uniref:Universal stress protein n=1 Tax=Mycobacterium montefiorense TaxID=154654 RepID=A0AA37PKZ8_9MYCO|nr:universal stress protein [Mycobacterium montefiorense]GBG39180.1 universal stress protein [Mycobacterium montefiorense]GKU37347.1 universal stress protein [Mycobacterium montefiorense]GKU41995.1 universal stress protein [Mycobacterium montefiorense]GKU45543.1 universal stress protein [Mycobacterium montefiorense]GKU53495.1 universal stress protein [Mycobacterium montefiorense]
MKRLHCKSVVVGIDGSKAAISAAKWAIDEAISRELPLRLVHVIPRDEVRGTQPLARAVECGEMALCQADGAVQGAGKSVEIETALLSGDPEQVLMQESQDAALVCLGVGKHEWGSDESLGSTAAALATRAHCPVAIIRSDSGVPQTHGGVIAVVLNDEPGNDEVVHQAMEEGRLRKATVRQIDRRLNSWVRRYPDVRVEVVAAGTGARLTENHGNAIDLAVVGQADADEIAGLGALNCHPIPGYPDCSVLLVRH